MTGTVEISGVRVRVSVDFRALGTVDHGGAGGGISFSPVPVRMTEWRYLMTG